MKNLFLIILILLSFAVKSQSIDSASYIYEVNMVRTNPKSLKSFMISYFSKKIEYNQGDGLLALNETLIFLDTIKPVGELTFSNNVYMAIFDHKGIDTSNVIFRHDSKCLDRIIKYDSKVSLSGENYILVNSKEIKKEIGMKVLLCEFIIDLYVKNKGHRNNIFNKSYSITAFKFISIKDKVYFIQEFAGY